MATGQPAAASEVSTMTGVVALSDQLAAAVADLEDAWGHFAYNEGPQARAERADFADNLGGVSDAMHVSINRISALAAAIRSRS